MVSPDEAKRPQASENQALTSTEDFHREIPADDAMASLVFESAAELFAVLSNPIRIRILNAVCDGEQNVSAILAKVPTTQSNLSQHLGAMYKSGILAKRREGAQVFYSVKNQQAATVCRAVCNQIAVEL